MVQDPTFCREKIRAIKYPGIVEHKMVAEATGINKLRKHVNIYILLWLSFYILGKCIFFEFFLKLFIFRTF